MGNQSTILLDKKVIELLKKARDHPRQTYNELLEKMARMFLKMKERDQYDKFLHEIQKDKMGEVWDNEYDEIWEKI
ncbi:MAG TPA: hypothetical protein VJH92_01305 [Candidatus Nanoarchaeia archaeon]|nr:hypothetical protein [Candidatus Nanoarchaeia archaeon]